MPSTSDRDEPVLRSMYRWTRRHGLASTVSVITVGWILPLYRQMFPKASESEDDPRYLAFHSNTPVSETSRRKLVQDRLANVHPEDRYVRRRIPVIVMGHRVHWLMAVVIGVLVLLFVRSVLPA